MPTRPESRIPELSAYKSVATRDFHHSTFCTFTEWVCLEDARELHQERSMPFFALACVLDGTCLHHSPGGESPCHPGMVTLIPPDIPYWVTHPHGLDRGCRIRLDTSIVLEALETLRPRLAESFHAGRALPVTSRLAPSPSLFQLSLLLARTDRGLPSESLLFEETALEILGRVLRPAPMPEDRPQRRSTLEQQRQWVRNAQLLMGQDPTENLRLSDIARAVHTSPFHLSRIFKREVGLTLHQYRNRIRLSLGLDRLMQGEEDLTDLALDLGFSSHSHFTRAFSAEFGLPPTAARNLPAPRPGAGLAVDGQTLHVLHDRVRPTDATTGDRSGRCRRALPHREIESGPPRPER